MVTFPGSPDLTVYNFFLVVLPEKHTQTGCVHSQSAITKDLKAKIREVIPEIHIEILLQNMPQFH